MPNLTRFGRPILCVVVAMMLLPLLFSTTAPLAAADPGWYDPDWTRRKEITIDNTKVENENFANFPVLISWGSDADLAAHALDNGDDILFTASDETTKLDHEIENFDGDNGMLVAWVRVPTLYDNENTIIYMYYGNASASNQENPTGVWDDNFMMVQHMVDNTTSSIEDSTSNANHGTNKGANEPIEADGKIAKAQDFDGTDDIVTIPHDSSISFGTENFTIEAWIKSDVKDSAWRTILRKSQINADYFLAMTAGNQLTFYVRHSTGWYTVFVPSVDWNAETFYYLVGTYDHEYVRIYLNVVEKDNTAGAANVVESNDNLGIGARLDESEPWNGSIDEIRISNVARSAGWILTTFNNENDPSTFYSVGSEEITASWHLIETWTGTVSAPAQWNHIETWTGTINAPAQWNLIETWSATVNAPAIWNLIETWTGAIGAPAEWNLIETWTGTVSASIAPAQWRLIETWTGTVNAPASWNLIETWAGTVQTTGYVWNLIETWTAIVKAPAEWSLIETWSGAVNDPTQWNLIETWTGTVTASAQWSLIESWTGLVQAPAAWQPIENWIGTVEASVPPILAWQLIETWTGTVVTTNNPNSSDGIPPPGAPDWTPPPKQDDWVAPGQREDWTPPRKQEDWIPSCQRDDWVPPGKRDDWVPPGKRKDWVPPGKR